MLGLSKSFIVFIILSVILAYALQDWRYGAVLMGGYIIFKIIWKILT